VFIAGGGTGGHLYPGIALAREFERFMPGVQVIFIGTTKGLEGKIIPQEGYEIRMIKVRGLMGMGILKKLLAFFELPYSLYQSFRLLYQIRPSLVIGVGGYASGPVVLMAGCLRIPRVLVEPNAYPGWTNRILSPLAHRIFVSFEETRRYFKNSPRVRVFGNPVRKEIQDGSVYQKKRTSGWTLLVMGGSQGAHNINKAMVEALSPLGSVRGRIHIIHQTGERDHQWVQEAYEKTGFDATVSPYLMDIWEAYTASNLVIARAGATTVAELAAIGRPAILIPFPHATHGHQEANAGMLVKAGAAHIIRDSELNGATLASKIHALLLDPLALEEMTRNSRAQGRPRAAEEIVKECVYLIDQRRKR
jgi:UDP-N-acetylglucosamine--N-acetylmuramyl-(pentapeptide) pyrophosphoryl-undecaprenol N-acetylglucosamine transferase